MRAVLDKERGTILEGSFGNEKNHYCLQKINAGNTNTEKCWIFFGIMTANASIITNRREKTLKKAMPAGRLKKLSKHKKTPAQLVSKNLLPPS